MTKATENNIVEIAKVFGDQSIKATDTGATLHLDETDLNFLVRVLSDALEADLYYLDKPACEVI